MRSAIDKLLPLSRVAKRLSVSRSVVREWAESGQFPAPVELPSGEERWRESEVAGWISGLRPTVRPAVRPTAATVRPSEVAARETEPAEPVSLADLDEFACEMLQAISTQHAWISGKNLAPLIAKGTDHTGGTWRRAARRLTSLGLIESNNNLGYRITALGRAAIETGRTAR